MLTDLHPCKLSVRRARFADGRARTWDELSHIDFPGAKTQLLLLAHKLFIAPSHLPLTLSPCFLLADIFLRV